MKAPSVSSVVQTDNDAGMGSPAAVKPETRAPSCGMKLSPAQKGMSQPPKKRVAMSAEAVMMCAYSAMKKSMLNFIEEYSVWYPVTSSDSASGRSKGSRLVSAKAEIRKSRKPSESGKDVPEAQLLLVGHDDRVSVTLPASIRTGMSERPSPTS